jgi:integrase
MATRNVYRRGKTYYFDITGPDGERIRRSTHQTDRKLAEAIALDALAAVRDANSSKILRKFPTLAEYIPTFEAWVKDTATLALNSKEAYQWAVNVIKRQDFAKRRMDKITNAEVSVADLGEGYSRRLVLKVLRVIYTHASEPGSSGRVYWGEVPRFKLPTVQPRALAMTLDQARTIASLMSGDEREIFLVLRGTGCRPSEVMSARWEHVYLDPSRRYGASHIQIPKGKTKAAFRRVPLFHGSDPVLRTRWEDMGRPSKGWVFPKPDSKAGHWTTIDIAYRTARDAAGLPKELVLYCARHGAVTDAAPHCTQKELEEIFGHSDYQSSQGYQHVDGQALGQALNNRSASLSVPIVTEDVTGKLQ